MEQPNKEEQYILVKCVSRDISHAKIYTDFDEAKNDLAADFIISIEQDEVLDEREIKDIKKSVYDKLANLNKPSDSITDFDYEIDLDRGFAWFNGSCLAYDWQILKKC